MATTSENPPLVAERPTLGSRIGDELKYHGFLAGSWLIFHLPLRLVYWLAARIGDFIYWFWHEHSRNAVSNTLRVLGPAATPAAIKRSTRKSFHNYIQVLIDVTRISHLQAADIERIVEARGWEHLHAAQARGKGVILVGCHSGNWDFAGAVLGKHGLPITALADAFQPKRLNDFVVAQRARMGIRTLPVDPGAMRKLFEALRRNEIIMLFVDRPVPGEGVEVQFFGESAWVPSGPAAIALKTGATIVPGYFMRAPRGRGWVGGFDAPIEVASLLTGRKEQDIRRVSQAIMAYMEGVIRRSPTQWYMFRRMWPRVDEREERLDPLQRHWQRGRDVWQRWRTRRAPAGAARTLEGLGLGVSVDPPIIEEWASGQHPAEGANGLPAPATPVPDLPPVLDPATPAKAFNQ